MHIPVSPYRIQLNKSFNFKDTKSVIPYLNSLGVTDIYASPILKARKGSQHGYDVVDPLHINPELGSEEDFESIINELKENGIFWLQDIVPNHMAFDTDNGMLMDIFEQRDGSQFYHFFDINWNHHSESFQGRVLAPFLGSYYSDILEKKELKIAFDAKGFVITYYDLKFPLLLSTYKDILLYSIHTLEEKIGKTSSIFINFLGIVDIFERVGQTPDNHPYNQVTHAKSMLWQLYNDNIDIQSFIDRNISCFNGEEDTYAINELDELLSKQCYRLSFWKVASEEINYRRFFTINELISLRIERKDVFDYTHRYILQLLHKGEIHGLRIDHIDGIYDPVAYLGHLKKETQDIFIVIEKILAENEKVSSSLQIHGTTGYDFMNNLTRLFCVKRNNNKLIKIYNKFTNSSDSYTTLVQNKKRLIIEKHMAGDIDNLAQLMKRVAGNHKFGRDITLYGLKRALVEVVTFFPVYRTYINHTNFEEKDKNYILESIKKAHVHAPALEFEIDFIKKFLLLELLDNLTEEEKEDFWLFIMKFQQLTAPIMAKGFEDTLFYSYNKLLSFNEVGGDPSSSGIDSEEFYSFLNNRFASFPFSFNATSTHDTKRGEDVRARINVISEIPNRWKQYLNIWAVMNRGKKSKINFIYCPDRNDEYLIYQTLLGTFPFRMDDINQYTNRIKEYIIKAIREAKVNTAWIKPDTDYEHACLSFVEKLLTQHENNEFIKSFMELHRTIAHYGIYNSLSQLVIKTTSPGVSDFYQGTELWELNLVDPDNRRPVNYDIRKKYLKDITSKIHQDILSLINELLETKNDGRIKLFLMYQLLQARKNNTNLFLQGDFIPLQIEGEYSKSVIAYARKHYNTWAVIVVPRFLTTIVTESELPFGNEIWKNTAILLPDQIPRHYVNMITTQHIHGHHRMNVGEILTHFPAALLLHSGER